ncbi:MAG: cytochrome c1 [Legionellales bacterium]|nr:cytochrome c1 [Legionellales bacterium]
MKKLGLFLIFVVSWANALASVELLPVSIDLHDQEAMQRGAKIFMNYCSGCHSLKYMRYNRMAKDLGLTKFTGDVDTDLLVNNLIFTTAKIPDPIENSMPEVDARQWFGRVPPDLSLAARERGSSWLYTYLKSFYADKNRPYGANNLLIPDVSMPNVLAPLQGLVIAENGKHPQEQPTPMHLLLVEPGDMSQQQFDSTVRDLVTFLTYVGEPGQLVHHRIGWFVLLFLGMFLAIAYPLKKIYWRNIH